MFALSIRSITNSRVVGPLAIFALSTQTRTLYFCGPKQGDHDADLPISEHYHARLRASSDLKPRSTADSAPTTTPTRPTPPPPTQPTTTTDTIPTLRISVTHAPPPNLSARHTMPSANKHEIENFRKAFGQMEAATHDVNTDYNNTLAIIQEVARLQFELRRGQVEGKSFEELEKVRREIEDLRCVFERIGRRWGI